LPTNFEGDTFASRIGLHAYCNMLLPAWICQCILVCITALARCVPLLQME